MLIDDKFKTELGLSFGLVGEGGVGWLDIVRDSARSVVRSSCARPSLTLCGSWQSSW